MSEDLRTAALRLERLCGHHDCSKFEDDDGWDVHLRECQQAFNAGQNAVVFVLATDEHEVAAYVHLHDIDYVYAETAEESEVGRGKVLRYFMIPALAVSKPWRGRDAFFLLAEKAVEVANLRKKELETNARFQWEEFGRLLEPSTYRGFLCVTLTNTGLDRLLARWGFKPFPLDPFYVFKPFPDEGVLPDRRGPNESP